MRANYSIYSISQPASNKKCLVKLAGFSGFVLKGCCQTDLAEVMGTGLPDWIVISGSQNIDSSPLYPVNQQSSRHQFYSSRLNLHSLPLSLLPLPSNVQVGCKFKNQIGLEFQENNCLLTIKTECGLLQFLTLSLQQSQDLANNLLTLILDLQTEGIQKPCKFHLLIFNCIHVLCKAHITYGMKYIKMQLIYECI